MGARAAKGAKGPRLVAGPKAQVVDRIMLDRFRNHDGPALVTACRRVFGVDRFFYVGQIQRSQMRDPLLDEVLRSIATTVTLAGRERSQFGKRIALVLKRMVGVNVDGFMLKPPFVTDKGTEFRIIPFVGEVQATLPTADPKDVAPSAPGDGTLTLIADHLIDLKAVIVEELAKQTQAIVAAMNLHWGPTSK